MKLRQCLIICDIKDPVTGEGYTRDPRSVTKKGRKLSDFNWKLVTQFS